MNLNLSVFWTLVVAVGGGVLLSLALCLVGIMAMILLGVEA